jgi:PAS domain S-box-containing protein
MKKPTGRYDSLRKRAEAVLEASGVVGADLAALDMRTLIHDLSVHQIELEMQNDELMAAQSALHRARDEYQGLYNNAPVGFLTLDGQGMILRHNQTAAAMLGSPGQTFLGVPLASLMAAGERDIFLARFRAFFSSPEGKNIDVRFVRTDGSGFWARITGRQDVTGEGPGSPGSRLLISVLDISAERLALEELRLARDAAEAASRAKSQFLSSVSHEIRTPMNGILGMAQLLGMTGLQGDQRTYVDLINVSGKNLVTLIDSVLDLSKIEAGRLELDHSEFPLKRCLEDTVGYLRPLAVLKGLDMRMEMAPDLPEFVTGDEMRLVQIVTNLVSNSVKFTERGSVRVRAEAGRTGEEGGQLTVSVSDTGIGIDPADHQRIFEPFVQTVGGLSRGPGTGLGLSICRRLVDAMGGGIDLESAPGQGSVFRVRIPFSFSRPVDAAPGPDRREVDGLPPLRVLLVEDNEANRFYLLRALEKMGHTVALAEDGRQALDSWRSGGVGCIVMDIRLPALRGDEVAAIIRAEESGTGRRTPILALSAFALAEEKAGFMEAGFDAYLTKPVLFETLRDAIARVARRSEDGPGSGRAA